MQRDFHYYCVYVLARAAGINPEASQIIATSSQLVDESFENGVITFSDGSGIERVVSAHHMLSVENISRNDQHNIWVPFHFLPGGQGVKFKHRMICIENSVIAGEMCDNALKKRREPFAVHLIGVAAHVFADTFAHYGFSGISSPYNRIRNRSIRLMITDPDLEQYIRNKEESFKKKYGPGRVFGFFLPLFSYAVEVISGSFGHGAVATYPDRPYLVWNFRYEKRETGLLKMESRNNPESYLRACEELFNFFVRFRKSRPDIRDRSTGTDFRRIKERVSGILRTEGKLSEREKLWKEAISGNYLFDCKEKTIPEYSRELWLNGLENTDNPTYVNSPSENAYLFYSALKYHRNYILNELLPKHDIFINTG